MKRIECSYKLIIELKRLFAFMTKSEKKYTDPTRVIRNIVDDFGNQMKIGDQQDISEVSEVFMSRVHEGVQAMIEPLEEKNESSPFDEETKNEAEGDFDNHIEENTEVSTKLSLLDKIELAATKGIKSQGFVKDLYYGTQIETTQ